MDNIPMLYRHLKMGILAFGAIYLYILVFGVFWWLSQERRKSESFPDGRRVKMQVLLLCIPGFALKLSWVSV